MPNRLIWYVGDEDPSAADQITLGGVGVDLTSKTVRFRMRRVGDTTLKVDELVDFKDANGNWRYDWDSDDLDTAGEYLAWIATTTGARDQTVQEFTLEVRAHGPLQNAYVELEVFKDTASLKGKNYADGDIQNALVAASRGIDEALHRRFWLDADANQVRYYTPRYGGCLEIDDLVVLTSLKCDQDGDGTFEETWTLNTDFILEPLNAAADGKPFERIERHDLATRSFPSWRRSVEVTGQFGWAAVPAGVETLTTLIAARLVQRTRQAPFGIIALGGDGAAVRAAAMARDPEYAWLTDGLQRTQVLA